MVERKQWLIVALLMVVLLGFGFIVYLADFVWSQGRTL